MHVCVKCRLEMRCTKTGAVCVWYGAHCYRGEEYECKKCGSIVRNLSSSPYHYPGAMGIAADKPLDMTGGVSHE